MRKINPLRFAAAQMKRKSTNAAKQAVYMILWKDKPPKGKKLT